MISRWFDQLCCKRIRIIHMHIKQTTHTGSVVLRTTTPRHCHISLRISFLCFTPVVRRHWPWELRITRWRSCIFATTTTMRRPHATNHTQANCSVLQSWRQLITLHWVMVTHILTSTVFITCTHTHTHTMCIYARTHRFYCTMLSQRGIWCGPVSVPSVCHTSVLLPKWLNAASQKQWCTIA